MTEPGIRFYFLHGLSIQVRWEGREAGAEVERFFSPFPFTETDCSNDDFQLDLRFVQSDVPFNVPNHASGPLCCYGLSIFKKNGYIYVTDGLSVFQLLPQMGTGVLTLHSSFKARPLLAKFNFFLIALVHLLSRFHLYGLHAAGLSRDKSGCLLPGESGSGKSSIALGLVRQGWHYTSDDTILLKSSEDKVEALSFRKKFCLDPVMVNNYPEIGPYLEDPPGRKRDKRFLDLEPVYPNRFLPCFLPGILIYTEIISQPKSLLIPIDQTASMVKLMKQSASLFFNQEAAGAHLDVLKRLVNQTDSYQLLAGRDLYERPEKISELLSEIQGTLGNRDAREKAEFSEDNK